MTYGIFIANKTLYLYQGSLIHTGKILTFNQSDTIIKDGKRIAVTPVWDHTS